MSATLVKSIRGKDLLLFENFTYFKEKELKSGEVFWRCVQRRKCNAKVFTVGPELTISRSDIVHNHEVDEQKTNRKVLTNLCKRKAEEDLLEKPSKIIRRVLSANMPESVTTNDVNYVRRNMYNCRRKIFPSRLPANINEVHEVVNLYSPKIKTAKGENFLFINSAEHNIIVFTCEANIRALSKMNTLYMDGTFSYCTKYFLQFFTIHGLQNGHYVPLLYCLLPNKSWTTYKTLFLLLKSNIFESFNSFFEPSEIYVDFEKAIHTAIIHVWPSVKISGCRFHLHQAWYRKIQFLGLSEHYKNNSEIGNWLKLTFGMTYLQPEHVADCFVFDLMAYKPDNSLLDKYADYLLETYIEENATFPTNIWAEEVASNTRTTNACESFHSRFNASFYSTHPSIYVFIEKLKEFQVDTDIKIQSLHIPNKIKDRQVKNKLKYLENCINRLKSGHLSRLEFIKCVCHSSLPN